MNAKYGASDTLIAMDADLNASDLILLDVIIPRNFVSA